MADGASMPKARSRGKRVLIAAGSVTAVLCAVGTAVIGVSTEGFGLFDEKRPCVPPPATTVAPDLPELDFLLPPVPSPDGRHMFAPDGMALFEVATGKRLWELDVQPAELVAPVFSADGKRLVVHGRVPNELMDRIPGTVVVDVATGKTVRTIVAAQGNDKSSLGFDFYSIRGTAISPDGGLVATVDDEKRVRFWNMRNGRVQGQLTLESETSAAPGGNVLLFSPDGNRLALGDANGDVRLWRVDDRKPDGELSFPGGPIWTMAFSPDGRRLATISRDKKLRTMEIETGQSVVAETFMAMKRMGFSADGASVISYGEIFIAVRSDAATGKVLAKLDLCGADAEALIMPGGKSLLVPAPGSLGTYPMP